MAALTGNWQQYKTEKMDDYLKEIGIGYLKRCIIAKVSPKMVITCKDRKWSIVTTTSLSHQSMEFTEGEDFDTEMPQVAEGMFHCSPTVEEKKISVKAQPENKDLKATETIREIKDDENELLMTMKCGEVVCKRYFKRC